MTDKINQTFNSERWMWFKILKALEVFGIAASTIGSYFYGKLIYWLIGRPLDNWFIVWLVGLTSFILTLAGLYLIGLVIIGWLKVNWRWAGNLAKNRLAKQRHKK